MPISIVQQKNINPLNLRLNTLVPTVLGGNAYLLQIKITASNLIQVCVPTLEHWNEKGARHIVLIDISFLSTIYVLFILLSFYTI